MSDSPPQSPPASPLPSSPPQEEAADPGADDNNVWYEYQDDEGKSYYYNQATEETMWEVPPGAIVKKAEEEDDEGEEGEAYQEEGEGEGESGAHDPGANENSHAADGHDQNADGEITEPMEDSQGDTEAPANGIGNDNDNDHGMGGGDSPSYAGNSPPIDGDDNEAGETSAGAEWVKYKDDEGRDYYHNALTGETQWERPDGDVDDGDAVDDSEYADANGGGDTDMGVSAEGDRSGAGGDHPMDGGYDEPLSAEPNVDGMDSTAADTNVDADDNKDAVADSATQSSESKEDETPEPEPEPQSPPKDPKEDAIEQSLSFLSKPDAVMEPRASRHLISLVQNQFSIDEAIKITSTGYVGQTAICGVLSRWLVNLKTANEKEANKSSKVGKTTTAMTIESFDMDKLHLANSETVRQLIEQVIAKTAKTHFTDDAEKGIFKLSKNERQFLEEMKEHERWRRLLIDLSAEHKDSALLTLMLEQISRRGHHREIANRMDQSDFFEVFHGMLCSELEVLGKLSMNGGRADAEELNQIDDSEAIVSDLKRQCTSTEYTYVYIIELLNELITRAKAKLKMLSGPKALGLRRATRKWERLHEDIEEYMIKPQEKPSLNPLSRKRRADISLTSSELYQRQRRRVRISNQTKEDSNDSEGLQYSVQSGVLNALKKYSRNTSVEESLLDQLLYNPYVDKSVSAEEREKQLGELLCGHPLSVEYFLRSLFLPGARVKSHTIRVKCSKLVAMAVLAAQKEVVVRSHLNAAKIEAVEIDDVESLSKMILKGSELFEQVENIVKFVISEDASNSSVGTQITNLCVKSSTIAQGFLMWAKSRSSNKEFPSTAAYPYTAPGILSLARIIALHHPLQRTSAVDLALIFLRHTTSELSFQKLNAIKEQAVRLLLIISTKGLAVDVFNAVARTMKGGGTPFDSGLIRYLISGALEIIRPPVSKSIVQSLGSLLLLPPCTEALNAGYFDSNKKQKLKILISQFLDAVSDEHRAFARCSSRDVSIATALKSAYKFAN